MLSFVISSLRCVGFFGIRPERSWGLLKVFSTGCRFIVDLIACLVKVRSSRASKRTSSKCGWVRSSLICSCKSSLTLSSWVEEIWVMSKLIINQKISIFVWNILISSFNFIFLGVLRLEPSWILKVCLSVWSFVSSIFVVFSL